MWVEDEGILLNIVSDEVCLSAPIQALKVSLKPILRSNNQTRVMSSVNQDLCRNFDDGQDSKTAKVDRFGP